MKSFVPKIVTTGVGCVTTHEVIDSAYMVRATAPMPVILSFSRQAKS